MNWSRFQFACCGLILATTSVGCGDSRADFDQSLALQGAAYLLETEPTEVMGVLEVRDQLDEQAEIAVIGRIGGVAQPWQNGKAAFVISDPSVEAVVDDHGHTNECGDGCAFCARTKAETATLKLAMVEVVDEQGRVVPHDARQLLGLETGQLVVVQGRARIDSLGHLILTAAGIYVRR